MWGVVTFVQRGASPQGQKRRFDPAPTTFGLPLETDIHGAGLHVSNVPNCDIAANSIPRLFDDLVGKNEQLWRNSHCKRVGGLAIDRQIKLGWLLDRKVTGFRASKNLVDKGCCAPEKFLEVLAIAHKTADQHELAKYED